MLATFVIGLREGLEAALIVGIVAAFLRASGHGLKAMWTGVFAAIAVSLTVGFSLAALEQALPQAAQEGFETVIGAVAVVFVTGMIFWMNTHARDMKRQLEAEASAALERSSALALAVMAFLAVLKEGFETSVFLLATFSAAQSASLAAAGAILGLACAALIGWAIFAGGLRIDLSRFFKVTGAFLILVAAGLVVSSLRTAHEAGWINAGQAVASDLSWLVEPGTVQSALVTGVLGIPADPRVIEVLGWFAYLVPVVLVIYWPARKRPGPRAAARLRLGLAAGLALVAGGLAFLLPRPLSDLPANAAIETGTGTDARIAGSLTLRTGANGEPAIAEIVRQGESSEAIDLTQARSYHDQHEGLSSTAYEMSLEGAAADAPATLTLQQVMELGGGRLPRGLNPGQHPGPFDAAWTIDRQLTIWTASGRLLDAELAAKALVSLTSDDLATPRTVRVTDRDAVPLPSGWQVAPDYRQIGFAQLSTASVDAEDYSFWARQLPVALVLLAFYFAVTGLRTRSERTFVAPDEPVPRPFEPPMKGNPHAAE